MLLSLLFLLLYFFLTSLVVRLVEGMSCAKKLIPFFYVGEVLMVNEIEFPSNLKRLGFVLMICQNL